MSPKPPSHEELAAGGQRQGHVGSGRRGNAGSADRAQVLADALADRLRSNRDVQAIVEMQTPRDHRAIALFHPKSTDTGRKAAMEALFGLEARQMKLVRQLSSARAMVIANGIDEMLWRVNGVELAVPHVNTRQVDATAEQLDSAEMAFSQALAGAWD